MKFCLILALVTGCNAAIPAQAKTNQRALDVGIKITLDQAGKLTSCIQEDLYNQVPQNQTTSDFEKNCLPSVLSSKLATAASAQSSCLLLPYFSSFIGQNSSFSAFSTIVGNVANPVWKNFYANMMKNFTAQKKTKNNAHDTVLNGGFAMFNNKYTVAYMNDLCVKIKANMTNLQFKCVVDNLKSLMDISGYKCAAFLKSGLTG